MREYQVYILASHARVLYIGVTSDLRRRVCEHKSGRGGMFTSRYRVNRLVYYESTANIRSAIEREKQLKGWTRRRKVDLVELQNPGWTDLGASWG